MDDVGIMRNLGKIDKYRIVNIDDRKIEFIYIKNRSIAKRIELDFGIKIIEEKYFKSDVPSEADVEYAINFIEDGLMSNEELVNDEDELYMDDKFMRGILNRENENKEMTRQEIEEIFTTYALVSMGRSPVYDDVEMNKEKYAKLLILREIMHHLNFTRINLK